MGSSGFESDTAVSRIADGRYRGEVSPRWAVLGGNPNGGYLTAIAARAMAAEAPGHPDPAAVSAHFLRPPGSGTVEVDVEVLHAGRTLTRMQADLTQGGVRCIRLLAAFADLGTLDGPEAVTSVPPELPDPDQLVDPNTVEGVERPPIFARFEHRMPASALAWSVGEPTGRGETGGYAQLAGSQPLDLFAVLVLVDAYPPAVFDLGRTGIGWVPTVELGVQLRRRPAPGWVRTRFVTRAVTGGMLEEDGEVWDSQGQLVALSRQLALAPR